MTSCDPLRNPAEFLTALFEEAVRAADPRAVLAEYLPPKPKGRVIVVGAGKAAASMAVAVEDAWSGPIAGLVVTRYDHGLPTRGIEVIEASHPVPDAAGTEAAKRILSLVQGLGPDDLVLCLISGGGSALLALPAPGVALADKKAVTSALLKSGAAIDEMNCVRKHLSAIKGGRLAAAAFPAKVLTLAISDVPGDDPAVIASGPTIADPTTLADARAVLARYGIEPPASIKAALEDPANETPKPGDPRLAKAEMRLISRPLDSLKAAAAFAQKHGLTPIVLGDALEGEARDVGRTLAGIARSVVEHGLPVAAPAVILSGGETTVTVRGKGRGGRNAECLLALGIQLQGLPGVHALCADTDGIDGIESNAGGLWHPDSAAKAKEIGLDLGARLADNDAFAVFEKLGQLVVTGPTRTNVNDFRAILVQHGLVQHGAD
ncbi:glycerate kinase [Lacibacterium aquatile]|uniref:Glycerate kinase n=1 Tax=Lacibacterium aquatile TaxID=1168082 RepID=A0ABW5DYP9_9PROT